MPKTNHKKRTLAQLRRDIDLTDDHILKLLLKRAQIAQQTTKLKGNVVFDPKREREILKRLKSTNQGPIDPGGLEKIYKNILSACREVQQPLRISYLGPDGSNTAEATTRIFGEPKNLLPQSSISDVFVSVEREEADLGVVPIENSLEGPIGETLDRLTDTSVVIWDEASHNIEHCLLSKEKNIKKIHRLYSHPQALAQSRLWVQRNLPGVQIVESSSTSSAAIIAAKQKNSAAIAPSGCAKLYSLNLLKKNIQDDKNNTTIFILIKKEPTKNNTNPPLSSCNKVSIAFSLDHKPGTLYECLQPFRNAKINLTKIQSRPSRRLQWDYLFFIDFAVRGKHKEAAKCIEKLKKTTSYFKILGAF